jgi:CBS domain-containing protein
MALFRTVIFFRALAASQNWHAKKVSQFMTFNPVTVRQDTLISEAASIMLNGWFNCLPVVADDNEMWHSHIFRPDPSITANDLNGLLIPMVNSTHGDIYTLVEIRKVKTVLPGIVFSLA